MRGNLGVSLAVCLLWNRIGGDWEHKYWQKTSSVLRSIEKTAKICKCFLQFFLDCMSETDAGGLPIVSLWEAVGSTRTSYIFDEKGARERVEHATKSHLASCQHQRSRRVRLMPHPPASDKHKSGSGGWLRRRCDPYLQGCQWLQRRSRMTLTLRSALLLEQLRTAHAPHFPRHGYWSWRYTGLPPPPGFLHNLHSSLQPSAWSDLDDGWQHFSGRQLVVLDED